MTTKRWVSGPGSFIAALCVLASVTALAQDSPVTLMHLAKVKDQVRFKIVIKADVNGLDATLTSIRKDVVTEVKDNGDIVTLVTPETSDAEVAGTPIEVPKPSPYTVTRDKSGKLLKYKPEKEDESILSTSTWKLFSALTEPVLAAKAVKPNDVWETELDNPVVEGKKFTLKSTFLGTEKVDGTDLWKIKQTAEPGADAQGNTMPFEQTSWLDPTSGNIVKAEAVIKSVPTNTQFGKLNFKMKVAPVKDAQPDKTAKPDPAIK